MLLDYRQQRVMELQADGYHQQRQIIENELIRIHRMEHEQLRRQISRVQELQILSHLNLSGQNEQQQQPFVRFNIYPDGRIEVISCWRNDLQKQRCCG